jgi:hypothetical protein
MFIRGHLDEVLKCEFGQLYPASFDCVVPEPIPPPGIKRGVPIGYYRDAVEHLKLYDTNVIGWWYNWKGNVAEPDRWLQGDNKELLAKTNFVPMIKESSSLGPDYIDTMYEHSPYLLAFNEPYGPVTNMSGLEVAESWDIVKRKADQLSQAQGHQVEIVSPVVAPKEEGFSWVEEFLPQMEPHGVDFKYLAVHYYTCEAQKLKSKLDELYFQFNRSIWLTEFNCGDGPRNASLAEHMEYMKATLPMLERHPYIVRYSWMASAAPVIHASLIDESAIPYELTPLGHYYNTFTATPLQSWGNL